MTVIYVQVGVDVISIIIAKAKGFNSLAQWAYSLHNFKIYKNNFWHSDKYIIKLKSF